MNIIMWKFIRFGSSFIIHHLTCKNGNILMRYKTGQYTHYWHDKTTGKSYFNPIKNEKPACKECKELVPEGLEIQMKLLSL